MSKARTEAANYFSRSADQSTKSSRTGANLLGWEEPENMSITQERRALVAKVKRLNEELADPDLRAETRTRLGKEARMLCAQINRKRPKLRFRGLESFFIDAVKDAVGDIRYRSLMDVAKRNWKAFAQANGTYIE